MTALYRPDLSPVNRVGLSARQTCEKQLCLSRNLSAEMPAPSQYDYLMQHTMRYISAMSSTLTIRMDPQTENELAGLTWDGRSRNAAVRDAIHLAHRQQILDQVRQESEALLHDPEDLAELKQIQKEMESLRAW